MSTIDIFINVNNYVHRPRTPRLIGANNDFGSLMYVIYRPIYIPIMEWAYNFDDY